MSRRLLSCIGPLVLLTLLGAAGSARADDDEVAGVVVAVDDAAADEALEGARAAGGARWSLERVEARAATPSPPPSDAIAALRGHYVDGEFLRCVSALHAPELDLDTLLEHGHRAAADDVVVFGAACAFGGDDAAFAESLLLRAIAAELPLAAIGSTTPEMQAFAERVRSAAPVEPLTLSITTRPAGVRVVIDGAPGCPATPCTLEPRRGRHHVRLLRFGYEARTLSLALTAPSTRALALAPATGELLVAHVAEALAEADPQRETIAALAADAYGARVVALVWREASEHVAAVYDRGLARVVATVRAEDAASATRLAVQEWRGIVEPTEIWEEPLFWVVVVATAAVAAVIVWAVTLPPTRTYAIEVL